MRLKRVSLSVYMYTRIVQILLLFYPLVNIPIPNLSWVLFSHSHYVYQQIVSYTHIAHLITNVARTGIPQLMQ